MKTYLFFILVVWTTSKIVIFRAYLSTENLHLIEERHLSVDVGRKASIDHFSLKMKKSESITVKCQSNMGSCKVNT